MMSKLILWWAARAADYLVFSTHIYTHTHTRTQRLRFESLFLSSSLESPLFQHLIFFTSLFTLIPSCLFFCPLSDPLPSPPRPYVFFQLLVPVLLFSVSLSLIYALASSPPSPTLVSVTVGEIALLEYLLHA